MNEGRGLYLLYKMANRLLFLLFFLKLNYPCPPKWATLSYSKPTQHLCPLSIFIYPLSPSFSLSLSIFRPSLSPSFAISLALYEIHGTQETKPQLICNALASTLTVCYSPLVVNNDS